MNIRKSRRLVYAQLLTAFAGMSFTSCSLVNDDLEPCNVTFRVRFYYDYNMKYADAFPAEVRSVNVWAFDSEGNPIWKGDASGDALKDKDFAMEVDLPPGTYSFLTWGGLKDSPFTLTDGADVQSIEALGVELPLKSGTRTGGDLYADYELRGLYHGYVKDVELKRYENVNAMQDVVIPLMKDTKYISVMLQHINGTPIGQNDFTISIEAANSELAWNNSVLDGPRFSYFPWAYSYGLAAMPGAEPGTAVNSLLAEMSTSRIMAGSDQVLSVIRNSDGRKVIRIPLVQYLLLVKGNYHKDLTDQEYLDRQDEYSMVFFLNPDDTWYTAAGIYINSWAVVPPQNENEI